MVHYRRRGRLNFRKIKYRSIQNCYPRNFIFSELVRRGVIYYAGSFLPQIIFAELIMRGNSVSHYVGRLFWGQKLLQKI